MRPITYSMQFRGQVAASTPDVLAARTSAPSCALITTVDGDGVHGRFDAGHDDEAVLRSEVVFGDDHTFEGSGTVSFGHGNSLRLRTVGVGVLGPSPDPHLRHGTAMWRIDGGEGRFACAQGRITSNFFVSDTGEVTDNQLGVIFVEDGDGDEEAP